MLLLNANLLNYLPCLDKNTLTTTILVTILKNYYTKEIVQISSTRRYASLDFITTV